MLCPCIRRKIVDWDVPAGWKIVDWDIPAAMLGLLGVA